MKDTQKVELQELQNLEGQGSLDETQKFRLDELSYMEQAEKTAEQKSKELESALAQKEHFRTKYEKEEADRKALEEKINKSNASNGKPTLNVEDYIDISASLEGLDQKEKERVAKEHKLTGKPITEIRKDEDFILWQSAYRTKVEKERLALVPNGTQPDATKLVSLNDRLRNASLQEKEKILREVGAYKDVRPRPDKVVIGGYK